MTRILQNCRIDPFLFQNCRIDPILIPSTQTWKQTFKYDNYGNREFLTTGGATTTLGSCSTAICNPAINTTDNRFSSGQGYSYDAAGSVTQDAAGQRFGYDAENHQTKFFSANNGTSTPSATYAYDGEGRRVRKIGGSENIIFVYDAAGRLAAEYSIAEPMEEPMAVVPRVSYLTSDHLGSPRIVTDRDGNVMSRKDFTAFGETVSSTQRTSGSTGNGYDPPVVRQDYTGYQKDHESGLEFAQARYYNGQHGRFTSVDPLTASAAIKNPQTFNRYSCALNSPYKFTDPLGLMPGGCGAENASCEGSGGIGSSHIREAEGLHNQRLRNTQMQLAAQRAANRGDADAMWDIINESGNKTDFIVRDAQGNVVENPSGGSVTADAKVGSPQTTAASATQVAAAQAQQRATLTEYLRKSAIGSLIKDGTLEFKLDGNGKVVAFFEFTDAGLAANVLKAAKEQFKNAKLGRSHVEELGEKRSKDVYDFRSYTAGSNSLGNESLQINIGKTTGRARADLDLFNPAQDVVGALGHLFVEDIHNRLRK